jgi:hypothetical protein
MGRKQARRRSTGLGLHTHGTTPQPYIPKWKPNSVQKQFLDSFERRTLRENKSPTEAKHARLALAGIMGEEAMWGTPREQEIRKAIYADDRALGYLQLLTREPGEESAMIIRVSMWAYAGERHPAMEDDVRELLIPRDQVLSFFRERGSRGASHTELVKTWPHYGTAMSDLRQLGFQFESSRTKSAGGDEDFRYVLKKDVRNHRFVKQHEAYAQIARTIEKLGRPAPLQEACRHAGIMARTERLSERHLLASPLTFRWKGLVEDDILRVAGKHLKRVTYLMAVAQRAVWHSAQSTDSLSRVLFERLHKRAQRSSKK